jgi:hypothetical protein
VEAVTTFIFLCKGVGAMETDKKGLGEDPTRSLMNMAANLKEVAKYLAHVEVKVDDPHSAELLLKAAEDLLTGVQETVAGAIQLARKTKRLTNYAQGNDRFVFGLAEARAGVRSLSAKPWPAI